MASTLLRGASPQGRVSPGGDFVLRGADHQIRLKQAGGMEKHVGRTVKVTGRWESGHERRLEVAKIEYIAEGCGHD